MKHLTRIALVLGLGLGAAPIPAQVPFTSLTAQSVGEGCNGVSTGLCKFLSPPTTLSAQLDAGAGTVTITVNALEFCGATVPLTVLVLGLQPAALPIPEFGVGCTLHLLPAMFLANTNSPFVLPVPTGLATLQFLAQGAALSVDPFGSDRFTTSNALSITLQ